MTVYELCKQGNDLFEEGKVLNAFLHLVFKTKERLLNLFVRMTFVQIDLTTFLLFALIVWFFIR